MNLYTPKFDARRWRTILSVLVAALMVAGLFVPTTAHALNSSKPFSTPSKPTYVSSTGDSMTFKSSFSVHNSRKDPNGVVFSVPVTWKQDGKEHTETLTSYPGSDSLWLRTVKVIDWAVTCYVGSSDCKINLTFMVDFENFLDKRPKGTDIRVALRLESPSLFGGNSQTSSKSDAVQPLWLFPPAGYDTTLITAGDKTIFISGFGFLDSTMDMGGTVEALYRQKGADKWNSTGKLVKTDYYPEDLIGRPYIKLTNLANDRDYEVKVIVTGPGGSTETETVVLTPHYLGPPAKGWIHRINIETNKDAVAGEDKNDVVVYFQKGGTYENPATGFVIDFGMWPLDKYTSRKVTCRIPENLTWGNLLEIGFCPIPLSFFSSEEISSSEPYGFRLRTVNAKGDWQEESDFVPYAFYKGNGDFSATQRARAYLTGVTQDSKVTDGHVNVDISAALSIPDGQRQPFDAWDAAASSVTWTAKQVSDANGQTLETLTETTNAKLTTVTNSVPSMVQSFSMRAGACYEMSWSVKAVANGVPYPVDLSSGPSKKICVGQKPSTPWIYWTRQVTPQSVEVYWGPSTDASVHTLRLLSDGKVVQTKTTSESSVYFDSLEPGTLYTAQGRSYLGPTVNDSGVFADSNTYKVMTTGAVSNLSVESGKLPREKTRLSWSPPAGVDSTMIDYYTVTVEGPSAWPTNLGSTTEEFVDYTFPPVAVGGAYEFSVSAVLVDGLGTGPEARIGTYTGHLPSAPNAVTAHGDTSVINVSWAAPAEAGTPAFEEYRVEARAAGGDWIVVKDEISARDTSATLENLDADERYDIRVVAVSGIGDSQPSEVVTAKLLSVPNAPLDLELTAHDQEIVATWQAPSDSGDGAITEYELVWTPKDGQPTTVALPADATLHSLTGLTNGVPVTVDLRARNAQGLGKTASAQKTPATVPGEVRNLKVTHGLSALNLTWEEPSEDGGEKVTGYIVEKQNGDGTWSDPQSTTDTSITLSGLTNGTPQTVRVCAVNSAGTSSVCATETGTPRGVPGIVPDVRIAPRPNAMHISWGDGTDNRGAEITNYRVDQLVDGEWIPSQTLPGSARSATIGGLTNGQVWTGRVVAQNSEGFSQHAATLTAVPADVPEAPSIQVSPQDTSVRVTVTANGTGGASVRSARVMWRKQGGQWNQLPGVVGQAVVVPGLENGTTYEFKATVANSVGESGESLVATTTPFGNPLVTNESVTVGNGSATLTWTENSNGSTITSRKVTRDGVEDSAASVQPGRVTFDGLTNGQPIRICVTLTNSAGSTSLCVDVTPRTVPDAPTINSIERCELGVPCGATLRLGLTDGFDGGSLITGYALTATSTNDETLPTVHIDKAALRNPIAVPGMVMGETYTVSVSAINAAGTGKASTSVNYTPIDPPGQATLTAAMAGDKSVELVWAEIVDNGSPLTTTTVEWRTNNEPWRSQAVTGTRTTISGLTNGTVYEFRVSGTNAVGVGSTSAVATATPSTTPSAPTITSAVSGNASATVSWSAPQSDGGSAITSYRVDWSADRITWSHAKEVPASASSATLTGLPNGVQGVVRVQAMNVQGGTPALSVPLTPVGPPEQVRNVTVVPGNGHVAVSWDAPVFDGGAPVTYEISLDGGVAIIHLGSLTDAILPWPNGVELSITVIARNTAGATSAPEVKATPRTTPNAVRGLSAADNADGTLHLEWLAPDSDGGSPITEYLVNVDGKDHSVTGTSVDVAATPGAKVTVNVSAVNLAGAGPATSVEATATSVPNSPQKLTAQAGNGSIALSWSTPLDGGAAITHYTIQKKTGSTWTDLLTLTENHTTLVGLTNGVDVELRVIAYNANGGSVPSSATIATPYHFAPVITLSGVPMTAGQTVEAGSRILIEMEGMPRGAKVRAEIHSTPVKIGSAAAGNDGRVSFEAVVPATIAAGNHTLVVIGEINGEQEELKLPVKVVAKPSTGDPDGGSAGGSAGGSNGGSSQDNGSGNAPSGSGNAGTDGSAEDGNSGSSGAAGNQTDDGNVGVMPSPAPGNSSSGSANSGSTNSGDRPGGSHQVNGNGLASTGVGFAATVLSLALLLCGLFGIGAAKSRLRFRRER